MPKYAILLGRERVRLVDIEANSLEHAKEIVKDEYPYDYKRIKIVEKN